MNDFQKLVYRNFSKIENTNLPEHVKKVVDQITFCRTNAVPGIVFSCPKHRLSIFMRESCNNRSCPACQYQNREEWKSKTKQLVLDTGHYHMVFKLPSFCYPYILKYYKEFIEILFSSSKKTIEKILNYSNYSHSTQGIISVLHTHGEENQLHPHIHMIMSDVGISENGERLVHYHNELFELQNYDSIYLTILKKALIELHKRNPDIGDLFLRQVVKMKEQRIFISDKYETAEHIIEYLGSKIKGSSVSLSSIDSIEDGIVRFKGKTSLTEMNEGEFLRRYLLHILPQGTKSVRYFGLYGSASRRKLQTARILLCEEKFYSDDYYDSSNYEERREPDTLIQPHKTCPLCQSKMLITETVAAYCVPRIVYLSYGKDPPPSEYEDQFRKLIA
ncbi:IS91 family transposase [Leptospira sp. GIMC2001]|uniref:IS91 family transposase n=1 Tax=Leptospira sp. GIMC2001 TaxID=1513297 RepID=UPI002349D6AC|nr:transposase [Leptospira sp. GIMC2001]WCL51035.1 transposase [Leptospira sp. GIMC2001]